LEYEFDVSRKCSLTPIGCYTVRRNGVVCGRFETHTHRNQDGSTYTFYGSEDFRDYYENFLENIHNHFDLE